MRPTRLVPVLTSGLLALSGWPAPALAVPSPLAATDWSSAQRDCVIGDDRITENSGLARSTYPRRVLFTHNDSGDSARFFALGRRCQTRAVLTVPGAPAVDWEDMAAGPGHTLWLGDIGGNNPRSRIHVVRVTEPKKLTSRSLRHTAYTLTYPDGPHNAEGLMVHPRTGRVFVVSKADSGAAIYRAPAELKARGTNRLTRVRSAAAIVTGADFSSSGAFMVLRTYTRVLVYAGLRDKSPIRHRVPSGHTFGESVAFGRGGALFYGAEGRDQWLWKARR